MSREVGNGSDAKVHRDSLLSSLPEITWFFQTNELQNPLQYTLLVPSHQGHSSFPRKERGSERCECLQFVGRHWVLRSKAFRPYTTSTIISLPHCTEQKEGQREVGEPSLDPENAEKSIWICKNLKLKTRLPDTHGDPQLASKHQGVPVLQMPVTLWRGPSTSVDSRRTCRHKVDVWS